VEILANYTNRLSKALYSVNDIDHFAKQGIITCLAEEKETKTYLR
jgi:hypothetical protein